MRRVIAWFVAASLLPSAGLALLAWRMAGQDRDLERDRRRVERERAVELAASRLQQIVAELDAGLAQLAAGASRTVLPDGVAAIVLRDGRLVARSGDALPYYPAAPPDAGANTQALAAADAREFGAHDDAGVERMLAPLAAADDMHVRAAALVRLARVALRQGRTDDALARWRDLEQIPDARVDGWPAPLRAAQARALLFATKGETTRLKAEARGILDRLARGAWPITREQYELGASHARMWLDEDARPDGVSGILARADVLERAARDGLDDGAGGATRQLFTSGGRSVFVLRRPAPGGLAVLAAGEEFLERGWQRPLTDMHRAGAIAFGLSDPSGRVVLGAPAAAAVDRESTRSQAATGLPWTVHAISTAQVAALPPLSAPTRLMLWAVAVMTGVVLTAGVFITRAFVREVEVARLQADFVAAVSHEFRTPLTTLRHLSELLLAGRVSTGRLEVVYGTLFRDSQRLQRLVEGLLNVARLASGRLEYRKDALDLAGLVRQTVSEFQLEAAEKGFRVVLDVPDAPAAFEGDRELLELALWNLLDNAVKYSPGRDAIHVSFSAGAEFEVRVRDEGVGIPAGEIEQIFQRFVRGQAASLHAIRGTGIGLAMARDIVRAHGGDITVTSVPSSGSTFIIRLPGRCRVRREGRGWSSAADTVRSRA
jgi:signal transduction histidine kinase